MLIQDQVFLRQDHERDKQQSNYQSKGKWQNIKRKKKKVMQEVKGDMMGKAKSKLEGKMRS